MTAERARPKGILRRTERWAVGLAMAVVAFVLERIVMRSVKRRAQRPVETDEPTVRSRGAEVEG
jgi:hypothetical protein